MLKKAGVTGINSAFGRSPLATGFSGFSKLMWASSSVIGKIIEPAARFHARKRAQFLEVLPIKLRASVFIGGIGRVEAEGENVVRLEAFVCVDQFYKARGQQPAPAVSTTPSATCATITIMRNRSCPWMRA